MLSNNSCNLAKNAFMLFIEKYYANNENHSWKGHVSILKFKRKGLELRKIECNTHIKPNTLINYLMMTQRDVGLYCRYESPTRARKDTE